MAYESCGNNLVIKKQEDFNKFMLYWNSISKHETQKIIEQKLLKFNNKIICGQEKFKCNMKNGECGL